MSAAPYSDEWRRHTRHRMLAYGMNATTIGRRTELGKAAADALLGHGEVSLEIAGPIDELLDALDLGEESARIARGFAPVEIVVGPAMSELGERVRLDPLVDRSIVMWGES